MRMRLDILCSLCRLARMLQWGQSLHNKNHLNPTWITEAKVGITHPALIVEEGIIKGLISATLSATTVIVFTSCTIFLLLIGRGDSNFAQCSKNLLSNSKTKKPISAMTVKEMEFTKKLPKQPTSSPFRHISSAFSSISICQRNTPRFYVRLKGKY